MSRFAFELRFAVRNLLGNALRTLVVFFTLTLVIALMVAGFCIDDTFRQIFRSQQTEQYLDVDLVMTYDANSGTRIMNRRTIATTYADRFRFYATFFNFYAVADTFDTSTYVNVFASSTTEMERVIRTELPLVGPDDVLATASYAAYAGLAEGDVLSLYLGGTAVTYTLVGIVPDGGLFAGEALFIDKVSLLERLYGVANLGNLGNTIYFDLAPGIAVDDVIHDLSTDPAYSSFVFTKVVDEVTIARMARFNSSVFFGIGLMALIALAMVLRSVFPILFRDLASQLGAIRILGGSSGFAFRIWVLAFVIILAGAVPTGILMAGIGLSTAGKVVGITTPIQLSPWLVLSAVVAIVAFLFLELALRFLRMRRRSAVALGTDRRSERAPDQIAIFLIAVALFVANRIAGTWATPGGRVAETAFVLTAAFSGAGLVLRLVASLARKFGKASPFRLFTLRHLAGDRVAHNAVKVATMAVVVIAIMVLLNHFIVQATTYVEDQITADYILTNIYDYDPGLKDDIVNRYSPESIDEAALYTKVVLHTEEGEKRLRFVFSLDLAVLPKYFDFTFDDATRARFTTSSTPSVLLPVSLGKVYSLTIGDTVRLAISPELPDVDYVVAGFIDTYFDSIAIVNLVTLPEYAEVVPVNALLINTEGDGAVARAVVKDYSSRMYYLIDVGATVAKDVGMFLSVADYMTLIGWAVVFCFVIVILDNAVLVYDAMKSDYARLLTLGIGPRGLDRLFIGEAALLATTATLAAAFILAFFLPAMPELMLLFDNYKVIPFDSGRAALAVAGGILAFLLGYGSYFIRVRRLRVIDEIKRY